MFKAALLIALVLSPLAVAGDLTLTWTPPTLRADGTPLSPQDIDGYSVYYGSTSGGPYPNKVDVADGAAVTATIVGLSPGTYFVVMTTYDVDGRESVYSTQVAKTINGAVQNVVPRIEAEDAATLTVNCDNPATWEDGALLDPARITKVEIYYTQDPSLSSGITNVQQMAGGCTPKVMRKEWLPAEGTWYLYAYTAACTVDKVAGACPAGNEKYTGKSEALTFNNLPDVDTDGVTDGTDNCTMVQNAAQTDSDGDGYGNLCDGDFNEDGATNTLDLNILKSAYRTAAGAPGYAAAVDLNGDGVINTLDLNIFKGLYGKPPGPSCCAP